MADNDLIKYPCCFFSQCPDVFIAAVAHPGDHSNLLSITITPDKFSKGSYPVRIMGIIQDGGEVAEVIDIKTSGRGLRGRYKTTQGLADGTKPDPVGIGCQ